MFASRISAHLRKLRDVPGGAEVVFLDAPLELPRQAGDQLAMRTWWQGLALVHFSAQLEPCLTHKNNLHTSNTPYAHPLSHKKRSS